MRGGANSIDSVELLFNLTFQFKGIECFIQGFQLLFFFFLNLWGFQQSLVWCLRSIVDVFDAVMVLSIPYLFDELQIGLKEVFVQAPFVSVQIVHEITFFLAGSSFVSEQLSDMGPVFLLNMGIIILVVGSASGKNNLFLLAALIQRPVDEFRSIVRVNAPQTKRQACFHGVNAFLNVLMYEYSQ